MLELTPVVRQDSTFRALDAGPKKECGPGPSFGKRKGLGDFGALRDWTRLLNAVPSGRNHQRLECGQLNKLINEVLQKMRLNHLIAAFAVVHYDKARPPRQ